MFVVDLDYSHNTWRKKIQDKKSAEKNLLIFFSLFFQ